MANSLDTNGTIIANGQKVAPQTWASSVILDSDTTKTLLDIYNSLVTAFLGSEVQTINGRRYLRFTRGNGGYQLLAFPQASTSGEGLMSASDKTKVNALPSTNLLNYLATVIINAVTGMSQVETAPNGIIIHTETAQGADDEWEISAATPTGAGVMSASDKASLNSMANYLYGRMECTTVRHSGGTEDEIQVYDEPVILPGDTIVAYCASGSGTVMATVYDGDDVPLLSGDEVNMFEGDAVTLLDWNLAPIRDGYVKLSLTGTVTLEVRIR